MTNRSFLDTAHLRGIQVKAQTHVDDILTRQIPRTKRGRKEVVPTADSEPFKPSTG